MIMLQTLFRSYVIFVFSGFYMFHSCITNALNVGNYSETDFKAITAHKLVGDGYHRLWVALFLIYGNMNEFHKACNVAIHLNLPKGVYIDPEQLNELSESYKSKNTFYLEDNKIEVEASEENSKATNVVIFVKTSHRVKYDFDNSFTENSFSLPIHLRYHAAINGGGYRLVKIARPSFLFRCPSTKFEVNMSELMPLCPENPNVQFKFSIPCSAKSADFYRTFCQDWKSIPCEKQKEVTDKPSVDWAEIGQEELSLSVPVGDLDHLQSVQVITLFITNFGAFYIIYWFYIAVSYP